MIPVNTLDLLMCVPPDKDWVYFDLDIRNMARPLQLLSIMSLPEDRNLLREYRSQTEIELTHILGQIVCALMNLLPVDKLHWLDLYDVPQARTMLHSLDFWEKSIRDAMVSKLASLTATTNVDTSARIVQILLQTVGAQEPVFHAVRIWVPRPLLIYLRRRLQDLPPSKQMSSLGAIALPWNMDVGSPRNIDIRMPNLLCQHLQPLGSLVS